MTSYRTIVAATDFSEAGDQAMRVADTLARQYGAQLIFLHALPDPARTVPVLPRRVLAWSTGILALQKQVLEALTDRAMTLTSRPADQVAVDISSGIPYVAIVQRAEELGADLIVLGAGAVEKRLGGIAQRVVRHAHCAVWVNRAGPSTGQVLAATDFSDPALPALDAAVTHARPSNAKVTALHCLEFGPSQELSNISPESLDLVLSKAEMDGAQLEAHQRLVQALEHFGPGAGTPMVTVGRAHESIVQVARELPAELICLGSAGRTGLRRVLLGSVAEKVVRDAPCSVLVVRSERPH